MDLAIEINQLKKSWGSHTVLNGVSFNVYFNEIFALLGVNGAGKTTLLECMEGLNKYDSGLIKLHGKAGIQLQNSSLPAHIRPLEAVRLFAKWNKTKIDYSMLEALGIDKLQKKQYAQLSVGQKRRLNLALALVRGGNIVFLDEPTSGLDVEGKTNLHTLIRSLKEQGKAVILSSHDMAEVENLCDRIAILNGGKIAFCGTPAQLDEKFGKQFCIKIKTAQGIITCKTHDIAHSLLVLIQKLKQEGMEILDIKADRGALEEHFIQLSGRDN